MAPARPPGSRAPRSPRLTGGRGTGSGGSGSAALGHTAAPLLGRGLGASRDTGESSAAEGRGARSARFVRAGKALWWPRSGPARTATPGKGSLRSRLSEGGREQSRGAVTEAAERRSPGPPRPAAASCAHRLFPRRPSAASRPVRSSWRGLAFPRPASWPGVTARGSEKRSDFRRKVVWVGLRDGEGVEACVGQVEDRCLFT